MNEKATDFGIKCKELRVGKGWSMAEAAEKLGCKQNSLTYKEQGKTNLSPEFIKKCLEVYKIPETEKAAFVMKALSSSNKLIIEMDKITSIPKEDFIKLMVILTYDLIESYPNTSDWNAVVQAVEILKESIAKPPKAVTVIDKG